MQQKIRMSLLLTGTKPLLFCLTGGKLYVCLHMCMCLSLCIYVSFGKFFLLFFYSFTLLLANNINWSIYICVCVYKMHTYTIRHAYTQTIKLTYRVMMSICVCGCEVELGFDVCVCTKRNFTSFEGRIDCLVNFIADSNLTDLLGKIS